MIANLIVTTLTLQTAAIPGLDGLYMFGLYWFYVLSLRQERPQDFGVNAPLCLKRRKFRKFDNEMVHSEVYLNKYVVSIAPFSTPACPDCSQNIT